ncbi:DUF5954 family protein [Streptomyces acidiscabies]|uniref:DUF5954 family protein n=1 Tax=Streptomyces acidiscabies TaxID=42234 RepID=A0AAP6BGJ3_9ACTN|nr:DUF5954 family protein [Streptomyces acidiscabies]MBZ3914481.1 PE-PGRS family protein [Streptomyces acidiscabies]MDX2964348.1 DUF5954 family protein [Streptomyces acidiscabies]MDX3017169.1 DUF5954 family protein [Streptomyces acidiscabies]MDX3789120.1 DUF5954 family protein [Streptomyces acidiscabies]GAV38605.1 hypothetical protein Saa2_01486 [Streptomyces acidiscabies]
MRDFRDSAPSYLTVRVTPQAGPLAAFAEQEAAEAMERYPMVVGLGAPQFFPTRECETGGWEILSAGCGEPQGARDDLGSHFRTYAGNADDEAVRRKWMAAAERIEREVVDEFRVRGERFRIARAGQFVRLGPNGPEPPRPSDRDTADVGAAYRLDHRDDGFVIDPYTPTGLSDGLLKLELLSLAGPAGDVPQEVRDDAVAAQYDYPGGVLLTPVFVISRRERGGGWSPANPDATHATPQGARDSLSHWLRVTGPWSKDLDDAKKAEWAALADRLDETRKNVLTVDGVRYRITRVDRIVRMGPDGPETPRPSDPDPEPPITVHVQQLKEAGLWEDDEHKPIELDERTLEYQSLVEEEEARQREWRRARGLRDPD